MTRSVSPSRAGIVSEGLEIQRTSDSRRSPLTRIARIDLIEDVALGW